jgi:hypothetical protein
MMIDGATIQVPFLADVVSPADRTPLLVAQAGDHQGELGREATP